MDEKKSEKGGNKALDESKDTQELTVLSQQASKRLNWCMFLGVIANTAMILYSHLGVSAVVVSSECPEGIKGCPESLDASGLVGACTNSSDAAILVPGNIAFDDSGAFMTPIGLNCLVQQQCMVDEVIAQIGVTRDCALCYAEAGICPAQQCFLECLNNEQSQACFDCFDANCNDEFLTCTGVTFPPRPTQGTDGGGDNGDNNGENTIECLPKEDFELFKVFNLTFVNSIEESFKGGSVALALFVMFSSGVWPYLKNVLMLVTWFHPMRKSTRSKVLTLLSVFGRWSLVDVFAVVVIINGVTIQKLLSLNSEVIVFSESRPGIYMFGIAALWALVQAELIRSVASKFEDIPPEKGTDIPSNVLQRLGKLKLVILFSSILSLVLILMGAFSLVISMDLSGRITAFDGPDSVELSLLQFGTELFSDCALYSGHGSPGGAVFLGCLFILLAFVVPLVHNIQLMVIGLTFVVEKARTKAVSTMLVVGNFASLDVFFVTMLTVGSQIGGLIEAAVGDDVDLQCGVTPERKAAGEFCLSLKGTLQLGAAFLGIAILLHWTAKVCVSVLVSESKKYV